MADAARRRNQFRGDQCTPADAERNAGSGQEFRERRGRTISGERATLDYLRHRRTMTRAAILGDRPR